MEHLNLKPTNSSDSSPSVFSHENRLHQRLPSVIGRASVVGQDAIEEYSLFNRDINNNVLMGLQVSSSSSYSLWSSDYRAQIGLQFQAEGSEIALDDGDKQENLLEDIDVIGDDLLGLIDSDAETESDSDHEDIQEVEGVEIGAQSLNIQEEIAQPIDNDLLGVIDSDAETESDSDHEDIQEVEGVVHAPLTEPVEEAQELSINNEEEPLDDNSAHYIQQITSFINTSSLEAAIAICAAWAEDIEAGTASEEGIWVQRMAILEAYFTQKKSNTAWKHLLGWLPQNNLDKEHKILEIAELLLSRGSLLSSGNLILLSKSKGALDADTAYLIYIRIIKAADAPTALKLWNIATAQWPDRLAELVLLGQVLADDCINMSCYEAHVRNLLRLSCAIKGVLETVVDQLPIESLQVVIDEIVKMVVEGTLDKELGGELCRRVLSRSPSTINKNPAQYLQLLQLLHTRLPTIYEQHAESFIAPFIDFLLSTNIVNHDLVGQLLTLYSHPIKGQEAKWVEGICRLFEANISPERVWKLFNAGFTSLPIELATSAFFNMVIDAPKSLHDVVWANIYTTFKTRYKRFPKEDLSLSLRALTNNMPAIFSGDRLEFIMSLCRENKSILSDGMILGALESAYDKASKKLKGEIGTYIIEIANYNTSLPLEANQRQPSDEIFRKILSTSSDPSIIYSIQKLWFPAQPNDAEKELMLKALARINDEAQLLDLCDEWPQLHLWMHNPTLAMCRLRKLSEQMRDEKMGEGDEFGAPLIYYLVLLDGQSQAGFLEALVEKALKYDSQDSLKNVCEYLFNICDRLIVATIYLDYEGVGVYKKQILPAIYKLPANRILPFFTDLTNMWLQLFPVHTQKTGEDNAKAVNWAMSTLLVQTRSLFDYYRQQKKLQDTDQVWPIICAVFATVKSFENSMWMKSSDDFISAENLYTQLQKEISVFIRNDKVLPKGKWDYLVKKSMCFQNSLKLVYDKDNTKTLDFLKDRIDWIKNTEFSSGLEVQMIYSAMSYYIIFYDASWVWDDKDNWKLKELHQELIRMLADSFSRTIYSRVARTPGELINQAKNQMSHSIITLCNLVEFAKEPKKQEKGLLEGIESLQIFVDRMLSHPKNLSKKPKWIAARYATNVVITGAIQMVFVGLCRHGISQESQIKLFMGMIREVGMCIDMLQELRIQEEAGETFFPIKNAIEKLSAILTLVRSKVDEFGTTEQKIVWEMLGHKFDMIPHKKNS